MLNYDPLVPNAAQEPLMKELVNALDKPFVYTGSANNFDLANYSTLLINYNQIDECANMVELHKLINMALASGKPLVLLNVQDGRNLSCILGIGLKGKVVIVRPYNGYNVFSVLGIDQNFMQECGQAAVIQNADGSRCFKPGDASCCGCSSCELQNSFENLCVGEQIRRIENILYSNFHIPQQFCSTPPGSTPGDLPESQVKINYIEIARVWNLTDQQVTNNSVIMEVSLIASFNPKYKYLRIRSMGAGFNPANGAPMQYDSKYDRGYFQSHVNIHLQPNTDKLRTLSTDPKNINNQTQYTTGSSFSVGVDVSKNPSFNASYTISESTTTVISDFNIYNNGAGITADWDFSLAMTEKSIWNIFDEPFLQRPTVKSLPALATRNLQTVTETVWYADNTFNDNIGIQLYWEVDHFHCYSTSDWVEHYTHKWSTVGFINPPVYINFGSVYA